MLDPGLRQKGQYAMSCMQTDGSRQFVLLQPGLFQGRLASTQTVPCIKIITGKKKERRIQVHRPLTTRNHIGQAPHSLKNSKT